MERLTTDWMDRARESGALAKLAAALAFRSAFVDGPAGRLAAARAAESEAHELAEVTHNPGVVPPTGAHTLLTLALSGREAEARATAAAVAREAPARGAAGEMALAAYFLGVLEISLGNYGSAVECLDPAYTDDTPLVGTQALPDLVEAAVRAGRRDLAERALQRLADRATATGTPLALGLLARSRALLAAPGRGPPGVRGGAAPARPDPDRSRSSPVPTCSTASGCAASAGGGRPAISCARRTTCSTRWACTASPSGARGAAGHRRARPEARGRDPGGAHPPGGADRRPGEPRERRTGRSPPSCSSARAPWSTTWQGVPEARGDLPHPARPPRHQPGLRRPSSIPASERPLLDGRR